ncbi:MAG: hypothetical protein CVU66_01040 [Deltaproteobacteria bacterium HGW-Deltaproteobacteria-23]|nr:MAG: hypothetical protein CVU66_01040 [Deltaproteobacteria bacterium HGW-Deltaproteobacteria-23]
MKSVRIIKNYDCKGYELSRQTARQKEFWSDVCFTEEPVADCDYLIVLNFSPNNEVINCPPENIWALIQEPDLPDIFPWVEKGHEQFARVYIPTERVTGQKYIQSQTCLPWFNNDKGHSLDDLISCEPPNKIKDISIVTSNISVFSGHLKRLEFLHYLQKRKPFDIDLFGRGINPIENKWDALAPYKYSIAIENTKSSHYWTEKLADCFLAFTLPIYYGAEKLEEYFPPESFVRIDIEDIEGSIETIKQVLRDDIWKERLTAIKVARELVLKKYQLFPFIADRIAQDTEVEKKKKAVYMRGFDKSKGYVKRPDLLFSVVVCTYNREDLLADCLESLACQTFNPAQYEVIVVDNNSSDNTARVAADFVVGKANFRLIAEPQQGLSHARNRGLAEAMGEYVAFIDDDARAPENWLETAARIIVEHSPDIFGGPALPIFGCETPVWYKENYGIRGDRGETGWLKNGFIVGTNIFFSKELLDEYGGFDPELGMKGDSIGYHEETALVHRAFAEGRKVYYSKELLVNDRVPDYKLSPVYFIYSKYMVGYDGKKLWKETPDKFDLTLLGDLLGTTFSELDNALRRRDPEKYPWPENYLWECLGPKFVELGKQARQYADNELLRAVGELRETRKADSLLEIICKEVGAKAFLRQAAGALYSSVLNHISSDQIKNTKD